MFFDLHCHNPPTSGQGLLQIWPQQMLPQNQYFSVGLHPCHLQEDWKAQLIQLEKFLQNPNCKAIGECGLDAFGGDFQRQILAFEAQIKLSEAYQKPLIVHGVKRWQEIIHQTKNHAQPKVIHGFNKSLALAEQLLQHNFHLSFGKSLFYKLSLQNTFKSLPIHRLFLESDDQPMDMETLYQLAAELKQMSLHDFQQQMAQNLKIFDL